MKTIPKELEPLVRNGHVLGIRTATLDGVVPGERADGERPRYRMSFSSEHPVLRYDWRDEAWYYEVLGHGDGMVDMARAADGLPLLLEHWRYDQIGRAFNVRLEGGRLVADVQFSRADECARYEQDVIDGIRKDVSIGYIPGDDYTQETRDGFDHPVRTYTRWQPYEVTLTSIPADPTVGVGRAAHAAPHITPPAQRAKEITVAKTTTPAGDPGEAPDGGETPVSRYEQVLGLCEAAGINDTKFVRELAVSDLDFRALSAKVRERFNADQAKVPSPIKLTEDEERTYSVARAIQSAMNKTRSGFEFEVSEEISKRFGEPKHGGFWMPTTMRGFSPSSAPLEQAVRKLASLDPAAAESAMRTLYQISGAGGVNKGAEFLFTEYGGFIDLLRTRMVLARLGVQFLTGLRGNIGFVRDTADSAFAWTDEVTNTASTSGTFGSYTLSPKTGQSQTRFTRQLMQQAPESIENLVRNKLAQIHARGVQRAMLFGSGTGNEPRGLANTPGVNTIPAPGLGANGGAPTYDFMVDHESEVFADDAALESMGYVTSARIRGRLKKTQQFASTNGNAVWTGGVEGEVNGYRAFACNDVRTDRVKGASGATLHEVYFGAWSKAQVAEWGQTEIMVDDITLAPTQIKVMGFQLIDIGFELPAHFCYSAEAAP